ncbi:tigger transposable element-derived protein 1-like [Homarus americanus]|uniref:tigger transposable element-derived protein 1-like n=1 Tax=Homarus americanus TaxID=6706 RepID=UPI001C4433BE|nr:tigger transposable element-derived protein 1-like [Homarus americanus]
MPTRTYISKNEAHAPGFKAAKDRMTVLLGANASGDLKPKPVLVYHSVNLRALKDNVPSRPPTIAELSDNIKVLFLPPNTTSLLQTMDQEVTAAFKAYYLRRTFKKLIAATEEGNDMTSVLQFWESFNIKHAIDIIVEAWGEQVGFAEVESADVEELLESHCEDLSTTDLQQLVAAGEIEDAEDDEVKDVKPRELPTSVLSSILGEVDKQLQILEDNNYNAERSRIAVRGVKSFLAPYEQLLCERRKTAKQQTLDVFFKSTPKKQNEPQSQIQLLKVSVSNSKDLFQLLKASVSTSKGHPSQLLKVSVSTSTGSKPQLLRVSASTSKDLSLNFRRSQPQLLKISASTSEDLSLNP